MVIGLYLQQRDTWKIVRNNDFFIKPLPFYSRVASVGVTAVAEDIKMIEPELTIEHGDAEIRRRAVNITAI